MADTPQQFAAKLGAWRKGLRGTILGAARSIIRPHVANLKKDLVATTVGRKLWGSAYWEGGRKKSDWKRFTRAVDRGASRIPLIVRMTKPKWESRGSSLSVGMVASGMARLISEGGVAKTTYLPQLRRHITSANRRFAPKGLYSKEWSRMTTGVRPKLDRALSEYNRKAGL